MGEKESCRLGLSFGWSDVVHSNAIVGKIRKTSVGVVNNARGLPRPEYPAQETCPWPPVTLSTCNGLSMIAPTGAIFLRGPMTLSGENGSLPPEHGEHPSKPPARHVSFVLRNPAVDRGSVRVAETAVASCRHDARSFAGRHGNRSRIHGRWPIPAWPSATRIPRIDFATCSLGMPVEWHAHFNAFPTRPWQARFPATVRARMQDKPGKRKRPRKTGRRFFFAVFGGSLPAANQLVKPMLGSFTQRAQTRIARTRQAYQGERT